MRRWWMIVMGDVPNAEATDMQIGGMWERGDVQVVGDEETRQHWEPGERKHSYDAQCSSEFSTHECAHVPGLVVHREEDRGAGAGGVDAVGARDRQAHERRARAIGAWRVAGARLRRVRVRAAERVRRRPERRVLATERLRDGAGAGRQRRERRRELLAPGAHRVRGLRRHMRTSRKTHARKWANVRVRVQYLRVASTCTPVKFAYEGLVVEGGQVQVGQARLAHRCCARVQQELQKESNKSSRAKAHVANDSPIYTA